jgi:hypothetical protein
MPDALFRLDIATDATLDGIHPREEFHGDDKEPALSLELTIEGENTLLDRLSPSLRQALYTRVDDATRDLPDMDAPTPKLRTKLLGRIPLLVPAVEGGTLYIEWGIGKPIEIPGPKVDKFRVLCREGGSVALSMRIGTSKISGANVGRLFEKLGQTISIQFEPPTLEARATDGGAPLFEAPADQARAATDAVIAAAKRPRGRPPKHRPAA